MNKKRTMLSMSWLNAYRFTRKQEILKSPQKTALNRIHGGQHWTELSRGTNITAVQKYIQVLFLPNKNIEIIEMSQIVLIRIWNVKCGMMAGFVKVKSTDVHSVLLTLHWSKCISKFKHIKSNLWKTQNIRQCIRDGNKSPNA